jgi:hypothetical protein
MTTLVENPNLIFIHIPKNGGSSVTRWLRENLYGVKGTVTHGGMQHIEQEFSHAVDYPSFAIVRNPWDRIVSSYFFKKKKEQIDCSFEDWLYSYPDSSSNWFTFKTPQVEWLEKSPTWILRFENLHTDFKQIQEYTNCSFPLEHKNATIHKDYKSYYTTKTKKYVEKLFEEDIYRFKYKF